MRIIKILAGILILLLLVAAVGTYFTRRSFTERAQRLETEAIALEEPLLGARAALEDALRDRAAHYLRWLEEGRFQALAPEDRERLKATLEPLTRLRLRDARSFEEADRLHALSAQALARWSKNDRAKLPPRALGTLNALEEQVLQARRRYAGLARQKNQKLRDPAFGWTGVSRTAPAVEFSADVLAAPAAHPGE